jgi:hypothetical protein
MLPGKWLQRNSSTGIDNYTTVQVSPTIRYTFLLSICQVIYTTWSELCKSHLCRAFLVQSHATFSFWDLHARLDCSQRTTPLLRASDPMRKTRNFGVAYCDFFWYTLNRQPEGCLLSNTRASCFTGEEIQ